MCNLKINILEILYCELSDIQIKNSIKIYCYEKY